jgi:uncharacterized protein YqfA (UPF0365 family)
MKKPEIRKIFFVGGWDITGREVLNAVQRSCRHKLLNNPHIVVCHDEMNFEYKAKGIRSDALLKIVPCRNAEEYHLIARVVDHTINEIYNN